LGQKPGQQAMVIMSQPVRHSVVQNLKAGMFEQMELNPEKQQTIQLCKINTNKLYGHAKQWGAFHLLIANFLAT